MEKFLKSRVAGLRLIVGLLVLLLPVCLASPSVSVPTMVSEPLADEPSTSLSVEALAYWAEKDREIWFVPVFLDEMEDDLRQLHGTPERVVEAAADRFSIDRQQAVALVDAEIRAAALLDRFREHSPWRDANSDPLEVAERVEDAVSAVGEPLTRRRMLIHFYGTVSTYLAEAPEVLRDRGMAVVVEAFEAGQVEEVWDVVEISGLPLDETFHRLLTASPDHPWLLTQLADSTWDRLDRATIRLHLARRGEATTEEALRDLLSLGASQSAAELWQSQTAAPDFRAEDTADDVDVRHESLPESLLESAAAALWMEGYGDEAAELMVPMSPIEVGASPKRADYLVEGPDGEISGDRHQAYYDESETWMKRSAQSLRRQLVRDGLRPSGLDPYDLALELLRVRHAELREAVVQGGLWPQAAAHWARSVSHPALERYFQIQALGMLGFQPNHRAQSQLLDWPRALDEGTVSASLYELRNTLYQEIRLRREEIEARIDALAGTSAAYFPPKAVEGSIRDGIERVVSPFSVRQLGEAAARGWIDQDGLPVEDAQSILDSGEMPPTLPMSGDQTFAFGRDGSTWWVVHQGWDGQFNTSSWLNAAYWLSLSHDGGHSWSPPLHTGLLPGSPLELLPSSVTLVRGELTLVGRLQPWNGYGVMELHDGEPTVFELRFDVDDLRADEDGDGWTDIFERGLATDPESEDTDGDGLLDPDDPLPRHVGETSAESEAIAAAMLNVFGLAKPAQDDSNPDGSSQDESTGFDSAIEAAAWEAEEADSSASDDGIDRKPLRLFGPDLPMQEIDGPPLVLMPEHLADDDRVGGRFDPRVRLWMINRAGSRAFLSWTGHAYGSVELIRSEQGWVPFAGYKGGGCLVIPIEPSEEAKAAAEQL